MNISVIYNQGGAGEFDAQQKYADEDTYKSAIQVERALARLGFKTELIEITMNTMDKINAIDSDLVYNICEWAGKDFKLGAEVISRLENRGLLYTGADAKSYTWSSDKLLMKKMFSKAKLPTPKCAIYEGKRISLADIPFPVIVKPSLEHCGIGIHQDSICKTKNEAIKKAKEEYKQYQQPILIEEYIEGREIHATMFKGSKCVILPPAEVLFKKKKGMKGIFSYESKWKDGTYECMYEDVRITKFNKQLKKKIYSLCQRAYDKMHCQGLIRIDMRMRDGELYILEINENPGLDEHPLYQMNHSIKAMGWNFDKMILETVKATLAANRATESKMERIFA